ncbi:hypothetical protein, partial [Actinoplanes sp. NPDC023714]|uniref:hypothetical protein n=1 Tax=Actinoplanes sp. NPDC023714 TaxID=3154322 RepID=UPI00340777BE
RARVGEMDLSELDGVAESILSSPQTRRLAQEAMRARVGEMDLSELDGVAESILSSPQTRRLAQEAIKGVLTKVNSRLDFSSKLGAITHLHQELVDVISSAGVDLDLAGTPVVDRPERNSDASPTAPETTISPAVTAPHAVDLKQAWAILTACYIVIAVVQHLASYLHAADPTFDVEKFVDHHINALGGAGAIVSVWALMKKRS